MKSFFASFEATFLGRYARLSAVALVALACVGLYVAENPIDRILRHGGEMSYWIGGTGAQEKYEYEYSHALMEIFETRLRDMRMSLGNRGSTGAAEDLVGRIQQRCFAKTFRSRPRWASFKPGWGEYFKGSKTRRSSRSAFFKEIPDERINEKLDQCRVTYSYEKKPGYEFAGKRHLITEYWFNYPRFPKYVAAIWLAILGTITLGFGGVWITVAVGRWVYEGFKKRAGG